MQPIYAINTCSKDVCDKDMQLIRYAIAICNKCMQQRYAAHICNEDVQQICALKICNQDMQ